MCKQLAEVQDVEWLHIRRVYTCMRTLNDFLCFVIVRLTPNGVGTFNLHHEQDKSPLENSARGGSSDTLATEFSDRYSATNQQFSGFFFEPRPFRHP